MKFGLLENLCGDAEWARAHRNLIDSEAHVARRILLLGDAVSSQGRSATAHDDANRSRSVSALSLLLVTWSSLLLEVRSILLGVGPSRHLVVALSDELLDIRFHRVHALDASEALLGDALATSA